MITSRWLELIPFVRSSMKKPKAKPKRFSIALSASDRIVLGDRAAAERRFVGHKKKSVATYEELPRGATVNGSGRTELEKSIRRSSTMARLPFVRETHSLKSHRKV